MKRLWQILDIRIKVPAVAECRLSRLIFCHFTSLSSSLYTFQPPVSTALSLHPDTRHPVASPAIGHWGTCPPWLSTISFLVQFGVNLIANYPNFVLCIVCEITRCRCQQLTAALSISTALVTKLLSSSSCCTRPWSLPWMPMTMTSFLSLSLLATNPNWRRHCYYLKAQIFANLS